MVRGNAIGELAELRPKAALIIPTLIEALKDSSAGVRYSAAIRLGNIDADQQAMIALERALQDKIVEPRIGASISLLKLGAKDKAPYVVLIKALGDEEVHRDPKRQIYRLRSFPMVRRPTSLMESSTWLRRKTRMPTGLMCGSPS